MDIIRRIPSAIQPLREDGVQAKTMPMRTEDSDSLTEMACTEHSPIYHIECSACRDQLHRRDQSLPITRIYDGSAKK